MKNNIKKFFFLSALLALPAMLQAQGAFRFDKETLKLEKTPEGEVVKFNYSFTNSGNEPILISEAKVACNCTKVTLPPGPVAPGKTGQITVDFDTKGKIGYQDRTIDLMSNVPGGPKQLRFKIMVDNRSDR